MTVEIDLDDFYIDDIINYLEDKGYNVSKAHIEKSNENKRPVVSRTAWDFAQSAIRDIDETCRYHDSVRFFYRDLFTRLAKVNSDAPTEVTLERIKFLMAE